MNPTLSRLSFLLLLAPLTGLQAADNRPPQPLVGVIRWDAWTGGEVTAQVERTLGPKKYHLRMPWFAEVLDDGTVRIDGGRQAIMDQEIAFAADAGLDYWAFLLYPETSSMSASLKLYLNSDSRRRINFCLILHNAFGVPEHQWPRERDRAVALLKEPGYQTVCGGRPLVYAFDVKFGGAFPAARFAEFLRAARQAGVDPYCVYMGWDPAQDFEQAAPLGFAAVSHYAASGAEAAFAQLVQRVETRYWAKAAAARNPYVPLVTTGWDKQPRKENPVSWERDHGYHRQMVFPSTAAPDEIAGHLNRSLAFVREHPAICPANTVIVYAWNEHDEGGWLCPTWTPGGPPNKERLEAVGGVLNPRHPDEINANWRSSRSRRSNSKTSSDSTHHDLHDIQSERRRSAPAFRRQRAVCGFHHHGSRPSRSGHRGDGRVGEQSQETT